MPKPISEQFKDLSDLIATVQVDDDIVEIGISRRDQEMIVDALRAASTLRLLREMHDEHLEDMKTVLHPTPAIME